MNDFLRIENLTVEYRSGSRRVHAVNDLEMQVGEGEALDCQVRLRHRQPLQACRLTLRGGRAFMAFDAPQRAVTPGQSAVFYQDRVCLGGAIIDEKE